MASIYALKGRFQHLLRPLVVAMERAGVTANQVTLAAALVSLAVAALVWWKAPALPLLYLLLPGWMFARMALNAIDGMLAREFGQKSDTGAYLNELSDVIADSALYLSLLSVPGVQPFAPWLLALAAMLTEFTGLVGPLVGANRRYDGPMGKSDRAFVIGVLGLLLACGWITAPWLGGVLLLAALLCVVTTWRRMRAGLAEAGASARI